MSLIHLSTDLDCCIKRYGVSLCNVYVGSYTEIRLNKGFHKLKFESLEYADDSYEIVYEMPEQDIETFLDIKLTEIKRQRLSKEEDEKKRKEIEQREQEEKRKEAERKERIRIASEKRIREEIIQLNEYKANFIDLGLSVLWSADNLLSNPSRRFGSHFMWGEVKPDLWDAWKVNYKYYKGLDSRHPNFHPNIILEVLKYNNKDSLLELTPDDDAASLYLGKGYHIPTKKQWEELFRNCRAELTHENNRIGVIFRSRIQGYLDKSILIPIAEEKIDYYDFQKWVRNSYWTATRTNDAEEFAYCAVVARSGFFKELNRMYGLSIRPVKDK